MVLGALRLLQRAGHLGDLEDILTDGGAYETPTSSEVDSLCEYINLGMDINLEKLVRKLTFSDRRRKSDPPLTDPEVEFINKCHRNHEADELRRQAADLINKANELEG